MIVAIFGQSCTGKTSLANALAPVLGYRVRHCGDAVREVAKSLRLTYEALSDDHHRTIDDATRAWSQDYLPCIVEGRFLDRVLAASASVLLVHLVASEEVRLGRWRSRTSQPLSREWLNANDARELAFRVRLYGADGSLIPSLKLDTSECTVPYCTAKVTALLEPHHAPRD